MGYIYICYIYIYILGDDSDGGRLWGLNAPYQP